MFVDVKVHSLDKSVQPVYETGLTGFQDQSDRLWNRSNYFFLWKTLSRLWWLKIIMQPRCYIGLLYAKLRSITKTNCFHNDLVDLGIYGYLRV